MERAPTWVFGPKRPRNPLKMDKRREATCTIHVCLDLLIPKSHLLPSNSAMCPRKRPKNGQKMAQIVHNLCQTFPEPKIGRNLGYMAQIQNLRAPNPPATPTFCGFQALKSANKMPRPPYQWSLGGARGQPEPRIVLKVPDCYPTDASSQLACEQLFINDLATLVSLTPIQVQSPSLATQKLI